MAFSRDNILPRFKSEFLVSFDPLQLAHAFYKSRMISKVLYDAILNRFDNGNEREDLCRMLLDGLTRDFSVPTVLRILQINGYGKLANKLSSVVYLTEHRIPYIGRTTTKPGTAAYIHFRNIKRNIHNRVWEHPYEVMRRKAEQLHHELENEKNPIRRLCITDKLVAHLGAEIDAISIKFDEHFFDHSIFIELQNLFQNSTNALIPKVIYLSRQVNAYAIGGNFERGEQLLSDAMQCAADLSPCLELVNLFYLDVVFRLWKLEFHPSRELKSSLIDKAKTGLQLLEYENEDIRLYLTRMFFIRMASGLLGIGNRGNIYPGYNIEDEDIYQAKIYLAEVDRLWNEIELRQEMFYSVARAKINQLEGEIEIAKKYSKRALELARTANFREGESIEKYCRMLESRSRSVIRSSHSGISERRPLNTDFIIQTRYMALQQNPIITSGSDDESSTTDERSFSSLGIRREQSLRFSTFSEESSEKDVDFRVQSTSVQEQNPSNFWIESVGQSLSFSLLSDRNFGETVHNASTLDISSLDFSSLFDKECEEGEASIASGKYFAQYVNLNFSSLLSKASSNNCTHNSSNQNAEKKDSGCETPNQANIDISYVRNEELPHQTFNVDDINSFELFQDRCEPRPESRMEIEDNSVSSTHSSDYEMARNCEHLTQQQTHINIQPDNLLNRTVNLEDVDSIVLFEDGDEPERNSR